MAPKDGNVGRELGEGYKYVSLGLTFAGGIVLFTGGSASGWIAGCTIMPLCTIAGGTLVGDGAELSHGVSQASGTGGGDGGAEGAMK